MSRTWTLPVALLALSLLGCNTGGEAPVLSEGECLDNTSCEGMQACIGGTCKAVSCLTNADCTLGSFCDTEGDYACTEGCSEDSDCLAGQSCAEGQCETAECVDEDVDCALGEHCTEGSCLAVEGFCDPCDEATPCAEGLTCHWFDKEKVSACLPICTRDDDGADDCPARTICYGNPEEETTRCDAGCPDLWTLGAF